MAVVASAMEVEADSALVMEEGSTEVVKAEVARVVARVEVAMAVAMGAELRVVVLTEEVEAPAVMVVDVEMAVVAEMVPEALVTEEAGLMEAGLEVAMVAVATEAGETEVVRAEVDKKGAVTAAVARVLAVVGWEEAVALDGQMVES